MIREILTIEKVVAGGDGLGFIDGKAYFVPEVIPGEKVEVEVLIEKKGYNKCKIIKIIKESKYRTDPFCNNYGICGGCNFQYTTYENQILLKKDMVIDVFRRNGQIELKDFSFFESPNIGYRNRVQFHNFSNKLGFKRRHSHDVINIKNCPLLVDGLNDFLVDNKFEFKNKKITIFSENGNVYIGAIDKECSVELLEKKIFFNPEGFFQSNLSILPKLIEHVNSYIIGENVMDLYCGVGLFSSFLPKAVKNITLVEMDPRVKCFVEKNLNDRNYNFYSMSLENYVDSYKVTNIDTVIIDPPRSGVSDSVRSYLLKICPKRIIYISCDPATMARDSKTLIDGGYSLSHFSCFDFYPNTNHIESFGIFDICD